MTSRYTVYVRWRNEKRAKGDGFYTDDLNRAKAIADKKRASWWGQNNCYTWIKVKDTYSGKYIYEA